MSSAALTARRPRLAPPVRWRKGAAEPGRERVGGVRVGLGELGGELEPAVGGRGAGSGERGEQGGVGPHRLGQRAGGGGAGGRVGVVAGAVGEGLRQPAVDHRVVVAAVEQEGRGRPRLPCRLSTVRSSRPARASAASSSARAWRAAAAPGGAAARLGRLAGRQRARPGRRRRSPVVDAAGGGEQLRDAPPTQRLRRGRAGRRPDPRGRVRGAAAAGLPRAWPRHRWRSCRWRAGGPYGGRPSPSRPAGETRLRRVPGRVDGGGIGEQGCSQEPPNRRGNGDGISGRRTVDAADVDEPKHDRCHRCGPLTWG